MSMIVSVIICLAPFPQLLKMLTLRYTDGMDAGNDSSDLHHSCTCIVSADHNSKTYIKDIPTPTKQTVKVIIEYYARAT